MLFSRALTKALAPSGSSPKKGESCTVFMELGFGRQLPPGLAGGRMMVSARGAT